MSIIDRILGRTPPAQETITEGVEPEAAEPEMTAQYIGKDEIAEAVQTLQEYQAGKAAYDATIIEEQEWYRLRHWEYLRRHRPVHTIVEHEDGTKDISIENNPEPTSAWLFNVVMNKHADIMDNYPEPTVLPREAADEGEAKILTSILPVILDHNSFEETFSNGAWEKVKHGTAATGVFWNPSLENGLGDIDIHSIDLLKIYWEPGVEDIQKSRNLFVVDLVDRDLVESTYPEASGKNLGNVIEVARYLHDPDTDTSDKVLVVDWYYKRQVGTKTVLHYCKFCGTEVLYASENDPAYRDQGWYWHGMYPVVFDVLFPEKGMPTGFGTIAITRDPQMYIDKLSGAVLEHSYWSANPRFWVAKQAGVNEADVLNRRKRLIEVEGVINEERIRAFEMPSLGNEAFNVLSMKIDELKETSGNRDVNNGTVGSGVTAAAAISALQEAGNKTSRDAINGGYRAYRKMIYMMIELIRQFYDLPRSFRILGPAATQPEYMAYSNKHLQNQQVMNEGGVVSLRHPVFDVSVKASKRNPFSRAAQNEIAKELYAMGFFNPERAQEASGALEMMEFDGKDKVVQYVEQGQTLMQICQQMSQQMDKMAAIIQALSGENMGVGDSVAGTGIASPPGGMRGGSTIQSAEAEAQTPEQTPYGEYLAAKAKPNPEDTGEVIQ